MTRYEVNMADTAYDTSSNEGQYSPSTSSSTRQYQATVEDDPESDMECSSCYDNSPSLFGDDDDDATQHQTNPQSNSSHRPSVLRSSTSQSNNHGQDSTPQASRPSRTRDENHHVHFSKRQPPQTYSTKNPSSPDDSRPRQNSSRPRASRKSNLDGRSKFSAGDLRWGALFSEDGQPTDKLKQLLGGIAEHLISEQEPKNSLVMTPRKMQNFYRAYPYKAELIPFAILFRCNSSKEHQALENIYRDLQCQYHLVPEGSDSVATVPALTAAGFVQWMVYCILADPDQEAYRLNRVLQALPMEVGQLIDSETSGADSERAPKQLSRFLLPPKPDENTKEDLLRICGTKKAQSSTTSTQRSSTSPLHRSSFKRGREDHRDDASRRYVPTSKVDDRGRDRSRDRSRSRSRYRYQTRHDSDRPHRRSTHYHRSPERSSKYHRDASPRPSRRSSTYENCSSTPEDSYYRDRGYSERSGPPLKRTTSTRSRRYPSPSRESRRSHRDRSPDRSSAYKRSSYHGGSSEGSSRDSFDHGHADSRSRHERQAHRVDRADRADSYSGDGHRSSRRR